MNTLTLLAETGKNTSAFGGGVLLLLWLALIAILIVACWKVYVKAKQPGWASIIPIYNLYVLLKIVNRPVWWLLLYLIPLVNVIVHLLVSIDLAKTFGKSELFGVIALWLFSPFGYLILGYGDAKYKGAPKR